MMGDKMDEEQLEKVLKRENRLYTKEIKKMNKGKKSIPKIVLSVLGIILGLVIVVAGVYVAYVMIAYYRIKDNQVLDVEVGADATTGLKAETLTDYMIVSHNIGFGAYTPEFTFFMDGGKSSRAASRDSVIDTINGEIAYVGNYDADFMMIQEVDIGSTRSYQVNQYTMLQNAYTDYYEDFAMNYDSPYLFYPFFEPHGASKSGLVTLSKYEITSALRRSLPISNGFGKYIDLDRCYSISRVPVGNGKELVLFNVHLSAYGNDAAVREGQVQMLCEDMKKEVDAGNYVICGGDFNHDLRAEEGSVEQAESWAYPFPRSELPDGLSFAMDQLTDAEKEQLVDSARNTDIPYEEGKSYTVLVDGFILSDNVIMTQFYVEKTGYLYSDHEPIVMSFQLSK